MDASLFWVVRTIPAAFRYLRLGVDIGSGGMVLSRPPWLFRSLSHEEGTK
jgi:hypothetical protein